MAEVRLLVNTAAARPKAVSLASRTASSNPVAVVIAIWLPRGLWGTVTRRLRFEFFPVGYFVVPAEPTGGPDTGAVPPPHAGTDVLDDPERSP